MRRFLFNWEKIIESEGPLLGNANRIGFVDIELVFWTFCCLESMHGQYDIGGIPPARHTNGIIGQGGNAVALVGNIVLLKIIIVGTTGGKM